MQEEKLIIEGLELSAKYLDEGRYELISLQDSKVYEYTSLELKQKIEIENCKTNNTYILIVWRVLGVITDFTYYLITASEADKIIRYFGLTGKQEPVTTTGFMQVGNIDDKKDEPVEGFADFYLRNKEK